MSYQKPRYRFKGRQGNVYRWEPVDPRNPAVITCQIKHFWQGQHTPDSVSGAVYDRSKELGIHPLVYKQFVINITQERIRRAS